MVVIPNESDNQLQINYTATGTQWLISDFISDEISKIIG